MAEPAAQTGNEQKSPLRRFGPLALLVAAIAGAYAGGLHRYLSLASIAGNREWLQHLVSDNLFLAIGAYTLVYIATVAFSLPGAAVLTILGGFLFGWLAGGLATVIGATLGATTVFLIAQTSVGDALSKRAGPFVKKLADGFRRDAFHYMLFLRLVPAFPFWLVNIAPALFAVPLRTFVITTFFGIIPGTFAFAILGSGLDSIIVEQQEAYRSCVQTRGEAECELALDAGSLVTTELIVAFLALGVVALIPVVVKRLRKQSSP